MNCKWHWLILVLFFVKLPAQSKTGSRLYFPTVTTITTITPTQLLVEVMVLSSCKVLLGHKDIENNIFFSTKPPSSPPHPPSRKKLHSQLRRDGGWGGGDFVLVKKAKFQEMYFVLKSEPN